MERSMKYRHFGVTVFCSALFVLGFPLMVHLVSGGELFGAFMIIPLTLVAWHYGRRAGAVASFVGIVFTETVFNSEYFLVRHLSVAPYWIMIVVVPALVYIFVGQVVGRLGEALNEIRKTLETKSELELTLKASQRFTQQYLNIAGVMLLVIDPQGRITLLNKKGHEILGYGEGELIGKDFATTCLPPRIREDMAAIHAKLLDGEPALEYYENPILTKAGDERLIAWHNTLLRDSDGKLISSLSSGEDITERRKAEEALIQSNAHMNAVMNALPDLMYEVDREGIVYDFRSSRPDRLLYPQKLSVIGRKVEDALPAEVAGMILSSVEQAGRRGEYRSPTFAFTNKGKTVWYELSIAAVGDHHATDCHFIVLERDVTERMRLEQRLIQSQKMEAVGRLSGGIAHDFNNILMVIIGYCDVILRDLGDRKQTMEWISTIRDSAERAASLTHQLLAFSRKQILTPKIVDVDELIRDSRAMLMRMVGEGITFSHESSGTGTTVRADPAQLQQVIMNLTVNARDAMAENGTITITVRNVALEEGDSRRPPEMIPGRYVLIEVSDTGSGMAPETLAHLFEPFFTTKELGRGTGLGLSIVYGIVKQSEGYIYVESKLGSGTTFRIYLPSVQGPGGESPGPREEPGRGTETILLVEDEDVVRDFIRQQLADCGYRMLEATTGEEALSVCQKNEKTIDLLITDVGLPGLWGWQVAEAFRKSNPDGRIIYMTGYTDAFGLAELDRREKAEILQKPFSITELTARIRRILDELPIGGLDKEGEA